MPDLAPLLLSPRGRMGRRDFWIVAAGLMLAGLVAGAVPIVGGVVGLALLWPWSAVAAKRLHDMGRSGKLVALPMIPSLVTGAMGTMVAMTPVTVQTSGAIFGMAALTATLGMVAMLVGIAFLAWIGLSHGDAGTNRWGEMPAPIALPGVA